jgi:hypothetical protein
MVSATVLLISLFYALLTAIGTWWLIYFNLRRTRALFSQTPLLDPATGLPLPPPPPGRYAHVPTPIFLLACLYGLSVVFGPIFAFLPFPAFFFGFIVTRPAAPILYLVFAILAGFISYGLLRLDPRARIATFVMMAIGAINIALSLLPWYQRRMYAYLQQIFDALHLPQPPAVQSTVNPYLGAIVGVIAGIAFTAYFAWALIKYRYAFQPGYPAPPPPSI